MLAWLLRLVARIAARTFFRRIRVSGSDRVPPRGPVLFVANHPNALVDPLVIMAPVGTRPIHFVAKAQLFKIPVLRTLIRAAGAIPVFRAKEFADAQAANRAMFARAVEVLRAGRGLAIFPEGVSHVEPHLQELKTGAARIFFATLDEGGEPPAIVPVGLSFDARQLFRSDVSVVFGAPIPTADLAARRAGDAWAAVEELTARIRVAIEGLTLNVATWEDHRLVTFAEALYRDTGAAGGTGAGTGGTAHEPQAVVDRLRAFAAGLEHFRRTEPARIERLVRRVDVFARRLEGMRLEPRHLAARFAPATVARFALTNVEAFAVGLPFALVGTVAHYLPYRVCGLVADRLGAASADLPATYKIYVGVLAFPITYALEVALAAWLGGWVWAWAAAILLPLLGYRALSFWERRDHVRTEAEAFLLLTRRPRLAGRLRLCRERLCAEIAALAGRYESTRAGNPAAR